MYLLFDLTYAFGVYVMSVHAKILACTVCAVLDGTTRGAYVKK